MLRVGSPASRQATLEVYDVAGRRVRSSRLALREGWQDISFDGKDDAGRHLASGVYFYRVSSGADTRAGEWLSTARLRGVECGGLTRGRRIAARPGSCYILGVTTPG